MPSPEYEAFLAAATMRFGGFSRDSIDAMWDVVERVVPLTGDERTAAEDLLLRMLADNDIRAVRALAQAGTRRAIPALSDRANRAISAEMRLYAGRALLDWGDTSGRPGLLEVLRNGDYQHQAEAAELLARDQAPEVYAALQRTLADPMPPVQLAAARALCQQAGLGAYLGDYTDALGAVVYRFDSPLAVVREGARADLGALLDARAAGAGPDQLGLAWNARDSATLAPFLAAYEAPGLAAYEASEQAAYEVPEQAALDDHERRWLTGTLLALLHREARAVTAVATLGVTAAIPALEQLRTDDPALNAAITAALPALRHEATRAAKGRRARKP